MNNNFRPISLSEGVLLEHSSKRNFSKSNISDFYVKFEDDENVNSQSINQTVKLDLTINNSQNSTIKIKSNHNSTNDLTKQTIINNMNVSVNYNTENTIKNKINTNLKKLIPSEKSLIYMLKKLFMFMFHLTLISIFEIFFFFALVSVYENKAILGLIMDFFKRVPAMCSSLTVEQKINFTIGFDTFANRTKIIDDSIIAKISRNKFNNKLYFNAWMYFLIIVAIDIVLLGIKFYYKIKINFKKILIENLFMILILALYEYMFFKSIILIYQNISQPELISNIVSKFNMCFN